MIDYTPFWNTLKQTEHENWYTLVNTHHVNPGTLHRLKHNMPISTVTIDLLCNVLHCSVADILRHIPDELSDQESNF